MEHTELAADEQNNSDEKRNSKTPNITVTDISPTNTISKFFILPTIKFVYFSLSCVLS